VLTCIKPLLLWAVFLVRLQLLALPDHPAKQPNICPAASAVAAACAAPTGSRINQLLQRRVWMDF
jgi:hypothetical protein